MARGGRRTVPPEVLVGLRRRLDTLPGRHPDRARMVEQAASLYGVSATTLYRQLRTLHRPRPVRRADRGQPRKLPAADLERWYEVIAALKLRTTNKKGRHLSTARALELMEQHGVETPQGLVRLPPGMLTRPTADRYLRQWGFDQAHLTRGPAAVRFQARRSNELWQFDLSPSDLKHVLHPLWSEPGRGAPTLMLYSVVDDRSGIAYQVYRCVYGEDVEGALRFLFNAMTAKLRTPLQIERHLTLAFEEGFRVGGEKPVTAKPHSDLRGAEVVEAVLSRQLDELEPTLTRHGYSVRTLSEQFNAKPAEIKRLMRGDLDAAHTRELADEMRAAGLPL